MSNIYALLIGINYYLPNKLSNGLYYKSLLGCVQDVNRVDEFLRHSLAVPGEHIIKLTSSNSDGPVPPESPEEWPTHKNIVDAFGKLESISQPGDQVYIHYSGHGGRATTTPEFADVKGPNGIDEVLVPMDLGTSEGNYLRDTELCFLLKRLVDQGRLVTVVLDSCHAGGATRAPLIDPTHTQAGVRGLYDPTRRLGTISEVDETPRSASGLVATPEQLKQAWARPNGSDRSIESGGGWMLEPEGYVLLAACRSSEYANEYPFEGKQKNGALSYWLLDTFKQMGPGFTYKLLHDRILAKVHGQFPAQTPQLQGAVNRIVFGREDVVFQHAVTVMKNEGNDQITLNAGQAHDVQPGATFNIFALYETDFTNLNARIAVVEVIESGAASSRAKVLNSFGNSAIEPGCQAVLFDRGSMRLRRRVRLKPSNGSMANDAVVEVIGSIDRILKEQPNGFIQSADVDEPADFLVTINGRNFAICDAGGMEIENLSPEIEVEEQDAAIALVHRLIHLSKYFNVKELDNDESLSPLADKLVVEITGTSDGSNGIATMKSGDVAVLRVQNNSDEVLNVSVLNLQPDWGISQIYPKGAAFEALDPGQAFKLPLKVRLPQGYKKGTDVLKVFATIDTTSFRWLELPAFVSEKRKAIDQLLAAFASEEAMIRQVEVLASPESEWTVRQVEIESNAT